MQIPNSYAPSDMVSVVPGIKANNVQHLELVIGKGTGSRHAYLTPSEARQVAYTILLRAEQLST